MAELVRIEIEHDPTVEHPTELEVQASAKSGAAWRVSYRTRGSGSPWTQIDSSDAGLDDILRRGGYRRVGGAPITEQPRPASRRGE